MTPMLATAGAKPKIHRAPAFLEKSTQKSAPVPGFLVFWAALFLTFAGAYGAFKYEASDAQLNTAAVDPEHAGDTVWQIPENKQAAATENKDSNIIALRGETGGIVGQLARIPSAGEPIQETKLSDAATVTYIDKNPAHDLLSIVNKY